ncbi:unnamed protein product [Sphagnum jensenii]
MLSVLGCGSHSASVTTSSPDVQVSSSPALIPLTSDLLLGTWTSSCHLDQSRVGVYIEETVVLAESTVVRTISSFLDENCIRAFFDQVYDGTYQFSASGSYLEKRSSVSITPLSSIATSLFEQNTGLCQSNLWRINQPQEFLDIEKCGYDSNIKAQFSLSQNAGMNYLKEETCDAGNECIDTTFVQSTQSQDSANPEAIKYCVAHTSPFTKMGRQFQGFMAILEPMIEVNEALIHKVAELVRLELNEQEMKDYVRSIGDILKHVDQLSQVNVDGVEPMVYGVDDPLRLRPDEVVAEKLTEELKSKHGGKVPRASHPLYGIPLGIKDVLVMDGVRTTAGSKMLDNYIPPYTATAVQKLEKAGAISLGKMNMDEFAMGSSNENSAYGNVFHPTHPDRVPGGSSGGSATAVAADLCFAALGTDTGGSIRLPASFCGIVGMKPTYGRISRYGQIAFASSLDQIGPMTKTVEDAAILTQIMSGVDVYDASSSEEPIEDWKKIVVDTAKNPSAKGLRVGVPKEYFIDGIDAEVKAAIEGTIEKLKAQGAEIIPVTLPHTQYAVATYYVIAVSEASSNLSRYDGVRFGVRPPAAMEATSTADFYKRVRANFGSEVKRRIILGTFALSSGYYDAYYKKAGQVRRLMRQDFENAFQKVDVIASPGRYDCRRSLQMSITHLGIPVDPRTEFETVIGLEVHVQLSTDSKIFSTAKARLSETESVSAEVSNANTTAVCAGHPGTLPSPNKKAIEYAIRAGLATHCRINLKNVFSRKHYFYPDLPKGYQISQLDLPICEHGYLDIELGEGGAISKRIGLTRIHMEEDAGKSTHFSGYSLVNLNRAGIPLVEVVSEPDMRSSEEAGAYLRKLYAIVTCIGICDGNLQEGNFRCDANVSIRPKGSSELGTRTEIKNVNSFRFVEKAIAYEAERQRQVILAGDKVIQETRLYDSQKNQTSSMRSKEEAQDYRYFPDPDLPPLIIEQKTVDQIKASLPELPDQTRDRYVKDFALSRDDAGLLTTIQTLARFFEASVKLAGPSNAKVIANLLIGEASRLINEAGIEIGASPFKPLHFSDLSKLISEKTISSTAAKQIITLLFNEGGDVNTLVEREGLKQVNDLSAIEPLIDQILIANPKQLEEFRSGKDKLLGFFVGQAMKATQGKANPALLQELVIKKLKG